MEEKKRKNEELKESIVCKKRPKVRTTLKKWWQRSPRVVSMQEIQCRGSAMTSQKRFCNTYGLAIKGCLNVCPNNGKDLSLINRQNSILNHKIFVTKSDCLKQTGIESFLQKCQNISRVVLWRQGLGEELDLITKYCRRVTKLEIPYTFDPKELIEFGNKHGQWLEEFGYNVKKFLGMCLNIKKIVYDSWSLDDITDHTGILVDSFKKLEVMKVIKFQSNLQSKQ